MNAWRIPFPSRRWLQFRLRTIFLLATALCLYLAWPHIARQYAFWKLCEFGDRDARDLWKHLDLTQTSEPASADTERIEKLVRQVLPRHY